MSGTHLLDLQATPAGAVSGKVRSRVFRNMRQVKCELVGSGRNRTSCPKGLRLQRSDGTSLSLLALPDSILRSGRRDRRVLNLILSSLSSETAWVPDPPCKTNGGRLSTRCPYACAYQSLSRRCRRLDRLAFRNLWRSGEVSIPTRCRAASFRNSLPSRRRPLQVGIWRSLGESNSVPSASEADALSNELRERRRYPQDACRHATRPL